MPPTSTLDAIELVLLLLAVAVAIRYLSRRVAVAEPISRPTTLSTAALF